MTEVRFVIERIPQALQALGLMLPALACCYAQFTRKGALTYFSGKGHDYYDKTKINLLEFIKTKFPAHDHEVIEMKPGKGQYVVLIPKGDKIDKVIVNRDEIITINDLKEGETIPESPFKHDHKAKVGAIGPWEHS